MSDPQKPDPNVLWCPKCRVHITDADLCELKGYREEDTLKGCKACRVEVGIPLECRSESLMILWGLIVIGVVFETWIIIEAVSEGFDFQRIGMICMMPFILIFTWLIYTWIQGTSLLWWKWKKWAKESGWEEENPKAE